jgi:hypothetical protein
MGKIHSWVGIFGISIRTRDIRFVIHQNKSNFQEMAHKRVDSRGQRFLQFLTSQLGWTRRSDAIVGNGGGSIMSRFLLKGRDLNRAVPSILRPSLLADRLRKRRTASADWIRDHLSSETLSKSVMMGKYHVKVDGVRKGLRLRSLIVHGVRNQQHLIDSMTIDVKKAFCKGLRPWNSSNDRAALRSIILGTKGDELTDLKLFLDGLWIDASLGNMISSFDVSEAFDIIEHIQDQAKTLSPAVRRKIMSDIDDTIVCNLLDNRYPSGTVYPGVLPFYNALSPQGLVFLTARPQSARRMTLRGLEKHGLDMSSTTVVFGSLLKLVSNSAMAERKYQSYSLYRRLYPEFSWVFIGDSGQGDLDLAKTILSDKNKSPPELILIHDIVDREMRHKIDQDTRKALARDGIHVFDTYITAARLAAAQGLISQADTENIINSVLEHQVQFSLDSEKPNATAMHSKRAANAKLEIEKALDEEIAL